MIRSIQLLLVQAMSCGIC